MVVRATVVLAALAALLAGLIPGPSWGTPAGNTTELIPHADGSHVELAIGASGDPVSLQGEGDDLVLIRCNDPACASFDATTLPLPPIILERRFSFALDANDNPVVSYVVPFVNFGVHEHLAILRCGDPMCQSGNTTTTVDTAGDVGAYSSIALDANGFPVVSYYRTTSGDLKLLHCGDATCSAGNSVTAPDTAGDVGQYTSLELDALGNPVVSYFKSSTNQLRVLHCGNPNCTASNIISTPDSAPFVGFYTSLELDSMGRPVVAYQDFANDDVRLLRCGDMACSSGNSITTPETIGSLGQFTSLALTSSDHPVIAHREASFGGNLRLVICGDATCNAGTLAFPVAGPSFGGPLAIAVDASDAPVVSYALGGGQYVFRCANPTCLTQDSDGDGCIDPIEADTGPGTQVRGGLRNPKNANDYFNPTGDGQNRIDDVLAVVGQYFEDAFLDPPTNSIPNPDYTAGTDRTDDPGSSKAWDLLGPNGQQRIDDILAVVYQYFHDCG